MSKLIQLRVEDNLKEEADTLFAKLGLTTNDAIKIFLSQAVQEQKIPFEIKLEPNSETINKVFKMLEELVEKENNEVYQNSQDLFKSLGI